MKPYEYSFVIKRGGENVEVFPVEFNCSLRAKSIKITPVLAKKVIKVSYPIYVLRSKAVAFLEAQKDWVAKQLQKIPEPVVIKDGAKITFLEKEYKISNIPNARRGVWFEDDYIFVSGDKEFLNRRVKDFLKSELKKYISTRVHYYAKKVGKDFGKISLKDTSSRWGSCASNGNLSFSWRLAFAPQFVVDYIVAHEVAHLVELNHSYKFWNVVRDIYAKDIDEPQKWLVRNATFLYSFD